MEHITKSDLFETLGDFFDKRQSFEGEFFIKRGEHSVKIAMEFKERETMIDKNGNKWIRVS